MMDKSFQTYRDKWIFSIVYLKDNSINELLLFSLFAYQSNPNHKKLTKAQEKVFIDLERKALHRLTLSPRYGKHYLELYKERYKEIKEDVKNYEITIEQV